MSGSVLVFPYFFLVYDWLNMTVMTSFLLYSTGIFFLSIQLKQLLLWDIPRMFTLYYNIPREPFPRQVSFSLLSNILPREVHIHKHGSFVPNT